MKNYEPNFHASSGSTNAPVNGLPGRGGGGGGGEYIGKTTRFNHYIMEIVAKMSNPAGLPRSLVWGE